MSVTRARASAGRPRAPPTTRIAWKTSARLRWFSARTGRPARTRSRTTSAWRSEEARTRSGWSAVILSTRNVVKPPTFGRSRASGGRVATPETPTTRSPAPSAKAISVVSALRQTIRDGWAVGAVPYTGSAQACGGERRGRQVRAAASDPVANDPGGDRREQDAAPVVAGGDDEPRQIGPGPDDRHPVGGARTDPGPGPERGRPGQRRHCCRRLGEEPAHGLGRHRLVGHAVLDSRAHDALPRLPWNQVHVGPQQGVTEAGRVVRKGEDLSLDRSWLERRGYARDLP